MTSNSSTEKELQILKSHPISSVGIRKALGSGSSNAFAPYLGSVHQPFVCLAIEMAKNADILQNECTKGRVKILCVSGRQTKNSKEMAKTLHHSMHSLST